jgi:hypothetical protein
MIKAIQFIFMKNPRNLFTIPFLSLTFFYKREVQTLSYLTNQYTQRIIRQTTSNLKKNRKILLPKKESVTTLSTNTSY